MPVYEYENPDGCEICPGRFSVIQGINDDPLRHCPTCGLGCRRVVSRVTIKTKGELKASKAAEKGFTTWKKAGEGQWEKVDGPGVDAIVGSDEDIASVKSEKKKVTRIDFDKDSP